MELSVELAQKYESELEIFEEEKRSFSFSVFMLRMPNATLEVV